MSFPTVNFLLHRHLALAELALDEVGRRAAGIGAMLPDVWRMADRRARAREGVETGDEAPANEAPVVAAILVGVAHHLAADRWFHGSEVFASGEAATRERLRAERWDASRMPLFAHVAWELCLDGALVRRQGAAELVVTLRSDLAAIDPADLQTAALRHGAGGDGFAARVEDLLAAIAAGPWIAGYADGAGIADRLGGVRRRIGLDPLSRRDRRRLGAVLDERLTTAVEALLALLSSRQRNGG